MLLKNSVLSFQINDSIRGSLSRLGSVAFEIINRQNLPFKIQSLFSEGLSLTSLFVNGIENESVFTIHVKGEGFIKTLFYDINHLSSLRGYIVFRKENKFASSSNLNFFQNSVLAITNSGKNSILHQSIIPFDNDSLKDSIQKYFNPSEKINTIFKTYSSNDLKKKKSNSDQYITGAIMLKNNFNEDIKDHFYSDEINIWEKANIYLNTLSDEEFLDCNLSSKDILRRVFGDFNVKVFEEKVINNKCKCSKQKILKFLKSLKKK